MLHGPIVRYAAIIVGTVLWDLGAIAQKRAVTRLPSGRLPVTSLLGSAGWMLGLLVTAIGWGMFVFGLDQVPISVARTITAGSYVILALFSTIFLRSPLSIVEWAAVGCVTLGIVLLGLQESPSAAAIGLQGARVILGIACITVVSILVFFLPRLLRSSSRSAVISLFCFAALSGLLGSVGDLLTKVLLFFVGSSPLPTGTIALAAAGLVAFYLCGFYMLSRAYQFGTVVGGVVVSDFFGRAGVLFLGSLALSERIGGSGAGDLKRALSFLLVLAGSLFLGRFSAAGGAPSSTASP